MVALMVAQLGCGAERVPSAQAPATAAPAEQASPGDSRAASGGIGAAIKWTNEYTLTSILKGGAADAAGLREGDAIVEIDGTPTSQLTSKEVVGALRGPVGTAVRLRIVRRDPNGSGERFAEHTLVRRELPATSRVPPLRIEGPVILDTPTTEPTALIVDVPRELYRGTTCAPRSGIAAAFALDIRRARRVYFAPIWTRSPVTVGVWSGPEQRQPICPPMGRSGVETHRGDYRLSIEVPFGAPDTKVGVVLLTALNGLDLTWPSPLPAPTDLTIGERTVQNHFPLMALDAPFTRGELTNPATRLVGRLFLAAPPQTFVTVGRDLDASDFDGPPPEVLPRAGEALLVWQSEPNETPIALNAFGEAFPVSANLLVLPRQRLFAPAPPVEPGSAGKNGGRSLQDAYASATKAYEDAVAQHENAKKRYETCMEAASTQVQREVDALERSGQRASKRRRDAVWNQGIEQAERRCGQAGVEVKAEKRRAARADHIRVGRYRDLEAITARLATFGGGS
jgi:hypothetical protein